jgi:hypothetical protein
MAYRDPYDRGQYGPSPRETFERGADERSYSSDRPYGDRSYGWSDRSEERPRSVPGDPEERRRGVPGDQGAREWSSVEGWRIPGPHTGRGPRGYQRSDERIREELNERLTAHGLIDATDVECRVVNGEVSLSGFIDSRAAKRAAADLAEDIYGVRQVHNELRVRSHAADEGVGRTSVLGLTESQMQSTHSPAAAPADHRRPRTRS